MLCGIRTKKFSNQGSNPCPLQWKCRVLTTGPPEKSHKTVIVIQIHREQHLGAASESSHLEQEQRITLSMLHATVHGRSGYKLGREEKLMNGVWRKGHQMGSEAGRQVAESLSRWKTNTREKETTPRAKG